MHFSPYMVEIFFADDGELSYISMLASNESSLEGIFSSHRRRKLDSGSTYRKGVSTTLHTQVQSAQSASSASYVVTDCAHEDTSQKAVDPRIFELHFQEADGAIARLIQVQDQHKQVESEVP